MKSITKVITTSALVLFSINAQAFKKDFVSEHIIPLSQLKQIKVDENTPTHEKYLVALSTLTHGINESDSELFKIGKEELVEIADKKEYGPAMFALGYNLRYLKQIECGDDYKCLTTPSEEVLYWFKRAEPLDVTGSVAFELSTYWNSMGKKGKTEAKQWSVIGRKKSDEYYESLRNR